MHKRNNWLTSFLSEAIVRAPFLAATLVAPDVHAVGVEMVVAAAATHQLLPATLHHTDNNQQPSV